jgi:putative membrane protein
MRGFLVRLALNTLGILVAQALLPGITVQGAGAALLAALVLGILNATLRPILVLLTLPFTLLTFGLFLLVVNALLLMLVSGLVPGFEVHGFGTALVGSVVISAVGWLTSWLIGRQGRVDVLVVRGRRL